MHSIEPFYNWRAYYIASEDKRSPFYGRNYSEFEFTNSIYNYAGRGPTPLASVVPQGTASLIPAN